MLRLLLISKCPVDASNVPALGIVRLYVPAGTKIVGELVLALLTLAFASMIAARRLQ